MSKRTVTVTGVGRASVAPDVVRLDLRVGHDAKDVATALSGASTGIAAVAQVVRDKGVADADIRTLGADIHQRWDNNGTAIGFTAQQRLGVTVRRPEAVGEILEAAASQVGNALLVDQVRLDVSDQSAGLATARDAAFADAKTKAQQYAALSAGEIGAVLGVAELGATPISGRREMKAMAAMDSSGGMPVERGELELSAGVTVTWELS